MIVKPLTEEEIILAEQTCWNPGEIPFEGCVIPIERLKELFAELKEANKKYMQEPSYELWAEIEKLFKPLVPK